MLDQKALGLSKIKFFLVMVSSVQANLVILYGFCYFVKFQVGNSVWLWLFCKISGPILRTRCVPMRVSRLR